MKQLKLKRYGTNQVAEKSFRQKNRLNLRLKELNITERVFDMFKDNNRRLLTERKLFEFKNSNIDFLKSVKLTLQWRFVQHHDSTVTFLQLFVITICKLRDNKN